MRDDKTYLEHILESIRRVEENTLGGKDSFIASHTLQDAVLHNLQTMTEATQRLSDRTKGRRPDIEWDRLAAFRNILVHGYLGVDLEVVWQIIKRDVPVLKAAVKEIVAQE